tara:strand:+ start:357 stop:554 length:198 start_codon:yes stop_codon:yes gene_type:complete
LFASRLLPGASGPGRSGTEGSGAKNRKGHNYLKNKQNFVTLAILFYGHRDAAAAFGSGGSGEKSG